MKAKFIKTAILAPDYPVLRDLSGDLLPEVAVAGRSNVGKSSLLNHLFQAKHLVKTSSIPGKTQALNFFTFNNIAFTDLPGYGYAHVPLSVRKQWGPMVHAYLKQRETLKLVLLLLDIRRDPSPEDVQFVQWAAFNEKALIVVLTKVDKLNQSERKINEQRIMSQLNAANLHYVQYSVPKNRGRVELMKMIQDALKDETAPEPDELDEQVEPE
jgi:GTP-binding protein